MGGTSVREPVRRRTFASGADAKARADAGAEVAGEAGADDQRGDVHVSSGADASCRQQSGHGHRSLTESPTEAAIASHVHQVAVHVDDVEEDVDEEDVDLIAKEEADVDSEEGNGVAMRMVTTS